MTEHELEHEQKQESVVDVSSNVTTEADAVRRQINDAKSRIDEGFMDLSRALYTAYNNAYFTQWGYETFKEYCDEELGISFRRAQYLVSIATVVKRHGLNWDDVVEIGWTRMRTIAKAIDDGLGGKTKDEWMGEAKTHTADQLVEMVKQARAGAEITEDAKIVSLQLRMNQDTASIVMDAVDKAKEIYDGASITSALESICYDWLQQSGEGPVKTNFDVFKAWAEDKYGIKISVEGGQDLNEMLEE